jgi:hypothetical protein
MKATATKETPDKTGSKASPKSPGKLRSIRYAGLEQSKAAGDWAEKKYSGVFRRLAQ